MDADCGRDRARLNTGIIVHGYGTIFCVAVLVTESYFSLNNRMPMNILLHKYNISLTEYCSHGGGMEY